MNMEQDEWLTSILNELDKRIKSLKDLMESDDYNFHQYPYFENEGRYKALCEFRDWIYQEDDD